MRSRSFYPIILFVLALCLGVSSSPLVSERSLLKCVTDDIQIVKRTASAPVYFCKWWNADTRTRTPFLELTVSQVTDACKCISPVTTSSKHVRAENESGPILARAQSTSCSKEVATHFTEPVHFCSFYKSYPRTTSPFEAYSAKELTTLCNCVIGKTSSTKKTTSTKKVYITQKTSSTSTKSTSTTKTSSSEKTTPTKATSTKEVSSTSKATSSTSTKKSSTISENSSTSLRRTSTSSKKTSTSSKQSSTLPKEPSKSPSSSKSASSTGTYTYTTSVTSSDVPSTTIDSTTFSPSETASSSSETYSVSMTSSDISSITLDSTTFSPTESSSSSLDRYTVSVTNSDILSTTVDSTTFSPTETASSSDSSSSATASATASAVLTGNVYARNSDGTSAFTLPMVAEQADGSGNLGFVLAQGDYTVSDVTFDTSTNQLDIAGTSESLVFTYWITGGDVSLAYSEPIGTTFAALTCDVDASTSELTCSGTTSEGDVLNTWAYVETTSDIYYLRIYPAESIPSEAVAIKLYIETAA